MKHTRLEVLAKLRTDAATISDWKKSRKSLNDDDFEKYIELTLKERANEGKLIRISPSVHEAIKTQMEMLFIFEDVEKTGTNPQITKTYYSFQANRLWGWALLKKCATHDGTQYYANSIALFQEWPL